MDRSLLVVAALLIATCVFVDAQAIEEERVTIHAEGVPIGTLLTELAQRHRLEKITIQAEVQQHPVWIALDRVPLAIALRRILDASGLDFAIAGRRVIVGDWTAEARRVPGSSTGQHAEAVAAEQEAAIRAGEAAAAQAIAAEADNESTILPAAPVRFVANGENITYLEPNFVPYKLRPEVRAMRMAVDVAKIP